MVPGFTDEFQIICLFGIKLWHGNIIHCRMKRRFAIYDCDYKVRVILVFYINILVCIVKYCIMEGFGGLTHEQFQHGGVKSNPHFVSLKCRCISLVLLDESDVFVRHGLILLVRNLINHFTMCLVPMDVINYYRIMHQLSHHNLCHVVYSSCKSLGIKVFTLKIHQ